MAETDFVTMIIKKEIYNRKKKKKKIDAVNISTNTKQLEINEENTLLLKEMVHQTEKKKRKIEKVATPIKNVLSNEAMKYKQHISCIPQEGDLKTNNATVHTEETYGNKVYFCLDCEQSFKFRFTLNEHVTKFHYAEEVSTSIDTLKVSKNDEVDTFLQKTLTERKKKKKKKKASKENIEEEILSLKKTTKRNKQTTSVVQPEKNLENYNSAIHTEEMLKCKFFNCDNCEMSFGLLSDLNKHLIAQIKIKDGVSCTNTSKRLMNNIESEKQIKLINKKKKKKRKKNAEPKMMPPKESVKQQLPLYLNNNIAEVHIKETNNSKFYKCDICEMSFVFHSELIEHNIKKAHITNDAVANTTNFIKGSEHDAEYTLLLEKIVRQIIKKKKKKIKLEKQEKPISPNETKCKRQTKCDVLLKEYLVNENSTAHFESTFNNKINKCAICGMSFEFVSALNEHKCKTHTINKGQYHSSKKLDDACNQVEYQSIQYVKNVLKCHVCLKGFKHKSKLSRHYKVHTGEKPFVCDICGGLFSEKSCVKVHYRVHTGEKPYACDVCGKLFRQTHHLRVHTRVHTGERPYKCSLCEMSFINSSNLYSHTRKKHDKYL